MERADLARWMQNYEQAWRTAGTDGLDRLFAPQASYRAGPFEQPVKYEYLGSLP